jgi:hypothetical protein
MSRYVGNLHERGDPNSNLGSFVVEGAQTQQDGIDQLVRLAQGHMARDGIVAGTLQMTMDGGVGIGTIELRDAPVTACPVSGSKNADRDSDQKNRRCDDI